MSPTAAASMEGFAHFEQITIDRWLMRTWGRWTGTLIEDNPAQVRASDLGDGVFQIDTDSICASSGGFLDHAPIGGRHQ